MMKVVLIISRGFEITRFFFRVRNALKEKYKFVFITSEMSSYYYLRYHKIDAYILKKVNCNYNAIGDIKNTLEFKMKKYNIEYMKMIYSSMYYIIEEISKKIFIDYIFFWNGTTIYELPGIDFAKKYKKNTLFFEIANLPGKIFVDKMGTNANSELYKNIAILKNYKISSEKFCIWKKFYLENKFNKHYVPQARKETLKEKFFHNIRRLINVTMGLVYNNIGYSIKEIVNKKKEQELLNKNLFKFTFDNIKYSNRKYIFFPLQVSNDSQILIHSDIGLMDAIAYTVNEAQKKHLDLIIKPHPAERNKKVLNRIYQLKQKYNFYFINDNTFKLIKYAEKVVTINSTVGLEAKICGKDVEVLGKAFYKDFTEDDLKRYILGYLIDIDYFSYKEISKDAINELEKRMNQL